MNISADDVLTDRNAHPWREQTIAASVRAGESAGDVRSDEETIETDIRIAAPCRGNAVIGEAIDRQPEDFQGQRMARIPVGMNFQAAAVRQTIAAELHAAIAIPQAISINPQPACSNRRKRRERLDRRILRHIEGHLARNVAEAARVRFVDSGTQ